MSPLVVLALANTVVSLLALGVAIAAYHEAAGGTR